MHTELIDRLAEQAGVAYLRFPDGSEVDDAADKPMHVFAALIANECAKVAEAQDSNAMGEYADGVSNGVNACALAIRAKFSTMESGAKGLTHTQTSIEAVPGDDG